MPVATCHPDKLNHARGLCPTCYGRELRATNPRYRADQARRNREATAADPVAAHAQSHRWYEANKDVKRAANAAYYAANREHIHDYRAERYRLGLDPGCTGLLRAAHQAVAYALRHGFITRQPCENCDFPRVVAHYEDYGKPLEITWLCRRHHKERHDLLRARLAAMGLPAEKGE